MTQTPLVIASLCALAACTPAPAAPDASRSSAPARSVAPNTGLVRRVMPSEDPGPPFYARVGYQLLEREGWVAIPFYRSPDLVPADFNLLDFFHVPGPGGPGAFAAPLLMTGSVLIEADAPLGTFPKQVELRGTGTPVWFVRSGAFHAAVGDGVLTIAELRSLAPLQGTTTRYHETLHPRAGEHKIVIQAAGTLPDGRTFHLGVTHVHDELRQMQLTFR
jgi:hypothetical protein